MLHAESQRFILFIILCIFVASTFGIIMLEMLACMNTFIVSNGNHLVTTGGFFLILCMIMLQKFSISNS